MESKIKHLEFIQGAINRMAGNLFLLKGWSITLVSALFAFSAKDANKAYVIIAYFPALIFWILDGYFLSQERRFRSLYEYVRRIDERDIDFSMNTNVVKPEKQHTWLGSMFSPTLVIYYGALAIAMTGLTLVIQKTGFE